MGSYSTLLFENYEIESSKNEISPDFLIFFQEEDLKVNVIKKRRGKIIKAKAYFENTLGNIIQRLYIIGYRKEVVQDDLRDYEIESLTNILRVIHEEEIREKINADINLLKNSRISDFQEAIKVLIDKNINIYNKEKYIGNNPYCKYLLSGSNSIFDKYPEGNSVYTILYCLREIYPGDFKIIYDFTDLINYDFFEFSVFGAYEEAKNFANYGHRLGERIIILTEGTTDVNILQSSMALLYPHLVEYFYFMDFHSSNASGSTSSLVNTIKSFIGAGINNKIIALFDNDTAAREALSSIKEIKIPNTISIQHLPDLDFAEAYPTLGLSGMTNMNINGMACSIELYLGDYFIKNNGEFIPIQWKGYSPKIGAYQGEILHKEQIQKKFISFIEAAKKDNTLIDNIDFTNLRAIFEQVFEAFNEV